MKASEIQIGQEVYAIIHNDVGRGKIEEISSDHSQCVIYYWTIGDVIKTIDCKVFS